MPEQPGQTRELPASIMNMIPFVLNAIRALYSSSAVLANKEADKLTYAMEPSINASLSQLKDLNVSASKVSETIAHMSQSAADELCCMLDAMETECD